tara:strand:+ start:44 stop:409 length:366 start_codon:yes stop_codon:yes gene_type:complete
MSLVCNKRYPSNDNRKAEGREKSKHYVYLMEAKQNKGVTKVGIATNVKQRLKSLQTGSPYQLDVSCVYGPFTKKYARQVETHMHDNLCNSRMTGEWFSLSSDAIYALFKNTELPVAYVGIT